MTETTAQFKRQLPRNMLLQVLSFLTQVGIGIWLVPYLFHHLGRAAYGLIPIAGALTQYVALISHSISSAVTRFLTIALQRNDHEDTNRIFNTAFFSYLAIGLIKIPIFALLIWNANAIFSIPQELYRDAIVLLTCSAAAFLINLMCSVFAVPLYANNRLDMSRSIDIARQILRLTGIVVLFLWFGPRLRYVGYVDLTLSVALALIRIRIARYLSPMLKIKLRFFDWSKVRQLTTMGGWLLVNHVGFLFFFRTDIWICNRFIGAESAGEYAALLQWPLLLRQASGLIGAVIAPMIVIFFARSEIDHLIRTSALAIRILSLAMAIPVSIVCMFSSSLLTLWLGDRFASLAPLLVIMLCPLVVHIGASPLFTVNMTMNRVKWPGLVTLVGGAINIGLAILFVKYFTWGIYGVAIANIIVLTTKNMCFLPVYTALILNKPWYTFIRSIASGLVLLGILLSVNYVVKQFVQPGTWLQLVLIFMGLGLVGTGVAWFGLSKQDRRVIIDLIPERLRCVALIGTPK